MSTVVSALTQCELEENNNLVEILALLRSDRKNENDARLASVVRGLCTKNSQLLALLKQSAEDAACDERDVFKSLVNDFIVWFDDAFVVFERYLACFPLPEGYEYARFEKPLTHIGCYSAFIDLALSDIRNPFVVDKLRSIRQKIDSLLASYSDHLMLRNLNKITFDNVQCFGGNKVSCSFTLDEIVDRTQNEALYVGSTPVELLLLNLKQSMRTPRSPGKNFNAMAVLLLNGENDTRALMFPPFRINEVAIGLSEAGLTLLTISYFSNASPDEITITGSCEVLDRWHSKVSKLFPLISNKLVPCERVELAGLGISCLSSDDDEDSRNSPENDNSGTFTPPSEALSEEHNVSSRKLSTEIMRKTLGDLTSTGQVTKTLTVVDNELMPHSAVAEYCYEDDIESALSCDEDELEAAFEIVNPKTRTTSPPKASVYRNAAGSAINIHEFGRDYNPSFCSVNELPEKKPKKGFFASLFRSNKSKESLAEPKAVFPPKVPKKTTKPKKQEAEKKPVDQRISSSSSSNTLKKTKKSKLKVAAPPPLDLSSISNHPEGTSSGPPSAVSTSSNRPLPLPFALPSSSSQYFFKPPGAVASNNNSTSSLASSSPEAPLVIPDCLKETINSENTIDFYISTTAPKALKVSKWKRKYGKWEMLTTNENLFVKIVINYELHKAWLLTFKEEYDEEYDEVVDKPLLILDLDRNTQLRKSSALDLEINTINSVDGEKMLIIMRCLNATMMSQLSKNLETIYDIVQNKSSPNRTASSSESSSTLMSSLMSKPSLSSTLTSIHVEDSRENSLSPTVTQETPLEPAANMLLLERMTVRLHKQMESYEKVHELSSWKTIAMYTLSVYHSASSVDNSLYHLLLESQNDVEANLQEISWTFSEKSIRERMEKIGKAGLLVRPGSDIYMIECKCKRELRRLEGVF